MGVTIKSFEVLGKDINLHTQWKFNRFLKVFVVCLSSHTYTVAVSITIVTTM